MSRKNKAGLSKLPPACAIAKLCLFGCGLSVLCLSHRTISAKYSYAVANLEETLLQALILRLRAQVYCSFALQMIVKPFTSMIGLKTCPRHSPTNDTQVQWSYNFTEVFQQYIPIVRFCRACMSQKNGILQCAKTVVTSPECQYLTPVEKLKSYLQVQVHFCPPSDVWCSSVLFPVGSRTVMRPALQPLSCPVWVVCSHPLPVGAEALEGAAAVVEAS